MRVFMKVLIGSSLVLVYLAISSLPAAASAELSDLDRHAKRGIQHGQRGFIHFQEMIAQLQYIQKKRAGKTGSNEKEKEEIALALRHAQEAFVHYAEALRIAGQSLGFFDKNALTKHDGAPHEEKKGVARRKFFKPVPKPVRPPSLRTGSPIPGGEGS